MRTFVFVFSQSLSELAHILHRNFITIVCAVNATSDVTKFTIVETYQSVRHNLYSCDFSQVHGQIFQLRQRSITIGLRFQNISTPQTNYCETLGRTAHAVEI
jgi:hypothetical protein